MVCIQILCLQNMGMTRVNPYIKTILSKTQENSMLKTRYLKGITTEQLFITSIQGIILSPLYLLTSLQNKLKQTRHTFYFLFYFTRSHNITIAIYIIIKITFYFVLASFFNYWKENKNKTKGERILTWIHGGCLLPQVGCCHGCSMRWPNVEMLGQSLPILILLLLLLLEASHLMPHAYLPLYIII
jgi:hypothetical protein